MEIYKGFDFYIRLVLDLILHNPDYRPWWTDIDKNIILGALPHHDRDHLNKIKNQNVQGVITLNTDYELQPSLIGTPVTPKDWINENINHNQIPIEDMTCPSNINIVKSILFIENIIDKDPEGKIYVHCKAGKGRSVIIVLCYLMKKNSWDFETAHEFLKSKRYYINLNKKQTDRCKEFLKYYI